MIFGRRPHQRGLPLPGFTRVDLCSAIEQQLDGVGLSRPRREHQDRLAVRIRGIRVGARLQQRIDDRRAAIHGRKRERSDAIAVLHICLRTLFEERLHQVESIGPRRPMQRRRSVRFSGVNQRALFEQRLHGSGVARLDGIDETRITVRRANGECRMQNAERRDNDREGVFHSDTRPLLPPK
jgi:hypothetical protein